MNTAEHGDESGVWDMTESSDQETHAEGWTWATSTDQRSQTHKDRFFLIGSVSTLQSHLFRVFSSSAADDETDFHNVAEKNYVAECFPNLRSLFIRWDGGLYTPPEIMWHTNLPVIGRRNRSLSAVWWIIGKETITQQKSPKQEVNTENKDKSSSVQHSEPLVCPVSTVLPLLGQEVSPSALVWLWGNADTSASISTLYLSNWGV